MFVAKLERRGSNRKREIDHQNNPRGLIQRRQVRAILGGRSRQGGVTARTADGAVVFLRRALALGCDGGALQIVNMRRLIRAVFLGAHGFRGAFGRVKAGRRI